MHNCPSCGLAHDGTIEVAPEPEPVPAETTSANDVEIAKVEADAVVQLAKIDAKTEESEDKQRIAELEGEVRGLRETIAALTPPEPPPPPAPVIVGPPEPEPEPTDLPKADERPKPPDRKKGFF
jgi:hypothetical protein